MRDLLNAMRRRWYVVVVAVALAISGFFAFSSDGGIYVTRTVVLFSLPGQDLLAGESGGATEGVIALAASVAEVVNNGRPARTYGTVDAPAYGAGVRQGMWIGLPNFGGQWATSHSKAEIEIQIVGRSAEWVRENQTRTIARIVEVADGQQSAVGTPHGQRVETAVAPLTTEIDYVTPTRSATVVAFLCLNIAAILVGTWLAVVLDRSGRQGLSATVGRRHCREPHRRSGM